MDALSSALADPTVRLPRRASARLRDALLVLCLWIWAALIAVWSVSGWGAISWLRYAVTWQSLPLHVVALLLAWPLLHELESGPRRTAWLLIGLATASDAIATLCWIVSPGFATFSYRDGSLLLYLIYYPLLCAALTMFFRSLGGTFQSASVKIEVLILACGVGIPIWLLQVRPTVVAAHGLDGNGIYTLAFMSFDGSMLVLMSMMVTRIVEWRAGRPLLLMALGILLTFVLDMNWLGRDGLSFRPDAWSNAGGSSLYYALLGSALALERHHRRPFTVRVIEGSRHGVLPVLALLVAAGLLCKPGIDLWHGSGLVLFMFTLLATLLAVARQLNMRHQIDAMQEKLTRHIAQAQLTELMRQSGDLIVVATADLRLAYVSPSSGRVLGIDPGLLIRRSATLLLGNENELQMRALLAQPMAPGEKGAGLELQVQVAGAERRCVQVFATDQLDNPLIAGIVLTLRDVTARRRLERELVEIAVLERARLAQEVRETLGSDLLQVRQRMSDLRMLEIRGGRATKEDIAALVSLLNCGIDTARRLSVRLSPLSVARGALDVALGSLCTEFSDRFKVEIDLDVRLAGQAISSQDADHVFRIVEQILGSIVRYCTRRMQLKIRAAPGQLSLLAEACRVASREPYQAMGLRLAEYRIHLLGGTMRQESTDGLCSVEARIPLSDIAPPDLAA